MKISKEDLNRDSADGYPEYSDEWKKCGTVCRFCEEDNEWKKCSTVYKFCKEEK